jgi:hypothetical protein
LYVREKVGNGLGRIGGVTMMLMRLLFIPLLFIQLLHHDIVDCLAISTKLFHHGVAPSVVLSPRVLEDGRREIVERLCNSFV